MELGNIDKSGKKEGKCIDSAENQTLDSSPKPGPSKADDVKSMQLDFWYDTSSSLVDKPSTSKLPSLNSIFKFPRWSDDDSIPQFGPKKFQRKGLSSTVTSPDNYYNSPRPDNSLKKSVVCDFTETMSVDEGGANKKVISPSDCQSDVEMQQTLSRPMQNHAKPMPREENVLKDRSKSFTEIDKATAQYESSDDIEMHDKSAESFQNEDNVFKNLYFESIPQAPNALSPNKYLNDYEMQQASPEKMPRGENILNYPTESLTEIDKATSQSESLDDMEIERKSAESIKKDDKFFKNYFGSIPGFSNALSPGACLNDIKMPQTVKISKRNTASKSHLVSIPQATQLFSASERTGMQKTSSEPMSSNKNFSKKSISETNRSASPNVIPYDIGVQKQSRKKFRKDGNVEKNTSISQSEDSSEGGQSNLASGCEKNMIHHAKQAKPIATEGKVNVGKIGVKRKRSGAIQDNIVETVMHSDRNGHYNLRPLILDRPRRSNVVRNSSQK